MPAKPHRFDTRVERLDTGLRMHVIPVPNDIAEQLPATNRVLIKIGTTELRRALQARKSGQPYISIGGAPLKELALREGSPVSVTLKSDPKPDDLSIAEELTEALTQDAPAKKRWDTFTPGKQRSLNHYVDSAKRPDTRARRAVELAEKIRTHTLYDDKNP